MNMKCNPILLALTAVAATTVLTTSCTHKAVQTSTALLQTVGNPYLPLWESTSRGKASGRCFSAATITRLIPKTR